MLNEALKKRKTIISLWILVILAVFWLLFIVYKTSYDHAEERAYNNRMSLYYETKINDTENAEIK